MTTYWPGHGGSTRFALCYLKSIFPEPFCVLQCWTACLHPSHWRPLSRIGKRLQVATPWPRMILRLQVHQWERSLSLCSMSLDGIYVTRQVSSTTPSARPAVTSVTNIAITWNLFCFARFWKVGTDEQTNGQHVLKQFITSCDCGSAEWTNIMTYLIYIKIWPRY